MAKIIGIDLGTTNSCVAVMEGNDPVVIPNSEGHRTTPSCVAFLKDGKRVVGAVAKRQAIANPDRTVLSIKRFMGRRFAEVPEETKIVSYKVVPAPNDDCRVEIGDKQYSPPEISAMILQKMRETAEDYLGERVSKAVITVPAYFNDSQRQATKDAGRIAGLEVERIINEPTAAALAYGLDKKKNEKVAVFDLGGGTFDISILEIGEEGVFQVLSTNGDTHLGGDDFDERIMHWLADGFQAQYGIDLRQDKFALQRLKEAAEKAKCELSQLSETAIREMYVTADASGPKHIDVALTRAKLEELVAALIERTVGPCQQALKDAGLAPAQVDEVILVGGMSRMPAVQNKVRQIFGKDPNKSVNPDEVVAIGAAIQGGILGGQVKDILLLDVTPLSLGIETLGGISTKLIDRNTTIPTRKSQVFTTADHNQTTVEIHVLQGEREMAAYNRTIGRFHLDGIPPALQGVPQIEVTFDIDANGILNVSAKDLATGNQQHITITASSGLADAEIDKMVKEAKEHADDDKRMREEAEVKNRAASAVFQSEKLIKDLGDKVTAEEKNKIEAAIAHLKDVKEKGNTAEIRSATEALETALNEMSTRLYQQAGPQGGAYTPPPGGESPGGGPGPEQPGPGGGGDQGDVVDADYEIIDDDGKK